MQLFEIHDFQKTILGYYKQNPRMFPWRKTTNPYEILVSEIMLQQTQTERVVEKYAQWLARFPTIECLAEASLFEVLAVWSGLGYNRRARFLLECAKTVCTNFAGELPDTVNELLSLPGIGAYTARAIVTFAFNRPEVFIETNIRSVYLFFFFTNSGVPISDTQIMPLIEQTLYRENPRLWYYALMDYGAKLKKAIVNPNRKSLQYTKQAKFEGSLRQARGAIIRQLTTNHPCGKDFKYIADAEQLDFEKIKKAGEKLVAEGLIFSENDIYKIKS